MKEPNPNLLQLIKIGYIKGIIVDYVQTGTDTAETKVEIIGANGKIKGWWRDYQEYLTVFVGYNSVAKVHTHYYREVEEWEKFVKKNQRDLSEYKRLKKKFEGE